MQLKKQIKRKNVKPPIKFFGEEKPTFDVSWLYWKKKK